MAANECRNPKGLFEEDKNNCAAKQRGAVHHKKRNIGRIYE
jgi:hypothetical protein